MENASKALIIAGAILLSILIIGIGMTVYRSASGVMSSVNMDQQEIDAFNSKFTMYEGQQVSGTRVRALLDALASNYRTNNNDPSKCPRVQLDTQSGTNGDLDPTDLPAGDAQTGTPATANSGEPSIENFKAQIQTAANYQVEFGYDSGTGIVTDVAISRN